MADDAVLIVSELASNAVQHSLSRVGQFTVRVDVYSDYMFVEVEDEGGSWFCSEPDGRPHGLDVVTFLVGSGNWGIEPTMDGNRVVWARLEIQRPSDLTTSRSSEAGGSYSDVEGRPPG